MAINYLNSIDLNQNELIHGTIENQASDALAGTPVEGQLYFNTTSQVLKVGREILPATTPKTYEWVEVGGGVETLSTTQTGDSTGNALTVLTDATGDVTINSFAYAGGNNIGYVPTGGTASKFLKGNGTWATVDNYGNWKLSANCAATINITSGNTVDFVGTGTTTVSRSTRTITINSADQYVGTVTSVSQTHGGNAFTVGGSPITSSGTLAITMAGTSSQYIDGAGDLTTFPSIPSSFNISLIGDVTGSGTTGADITTTISAGAVDFDMINTAAIVTEAEGIENNDNDTTLPTSAAVKAYADSLIVGGLIYQGGYNAATNTPDLDSSPSALIKKGWTYTVTADGDFFTEQVRVGDVLIAESDAPTALTDWTTVQNNVDVADASTIGLSNVVPGASGTITAPYSNGTATLDVVNSSATQKGAIIVSPGEAIDVSYSSGTATVSVEKGDATNLGAVIVKGTDPINVTYDTNGNATVDIEDSAASQKGAVIVSAGSGISVAYASGTATVTNTQSNSDNSFSGLIGDGSLTSLPITSATHDLGTDSASFMVQLVQVSDGATVYSDVVRGASGLVTVNFAVAPASNAIRVLIQKIG